MSVPVDLLRCPATLQRLHVEGSTLVSEDASCRYPIVDGVPILVDDAAGLFRVAEIAASASRYDRRSRRTRFVRRIRPSSSVNVGAAERFSAFRSLVLADAAQRPARVLVVGGGSLGVGMEALDGDVDLELIQTDVYLSPRVTVACDGHRLPFRDKTFDGAIIQAVLEHVLSPQDVVDELHRVLREKGVVYAETPFMQQVHEGAYDFCRFTDLGHRHLFRMFDEVDRGVALGPATSLLWAIRYFVRSLPKRRSVAVDLWDLAATFAFFWLTHLDKVLIRHPGAYDAASGVYFLGRRAETAATDREIVTGYRGTLGAVTVERGLADGATSLDSDG